MTDTADRNGIALPEGFEEASKQRFANNPNTDLTVEQYVEFEKNEFFRQAALAKNPALKYQPTIGKSTPCGNGDFDRQIDPDQWQGAYGSVLNLSANNPFANFTAGIFPGDIAQGNPGDQASQAHQTQVSAGTDPNVGIPTTAQGSAGAVRIGNAVNISGCELLSKTFVVPANQSTITFWYAVVLEDPNHPPNAQPFFWVRVTDANDNVVPGAFDFGNGSDRLIADSTNPFFQKATPPSGQPIVFKDWSCAQIDLSTQVGKQVTIEFVTGDCGYGGHWGYAYIDNFCGDCAGSPTGDITYNCESSTHCGSGQICFDYSLPKATDANGNPITGTIDIALDIYQNGILLTQLTSGILTSGSSYCFNVIPSTIPGINLSLGGFDFAAVGTLAIGSTPLGHRKIGTAPDGITIGQNNDYQIACKTCAEINQEQDAYLKQQTAKKVNLLPRTSCDCPTSNTSDPGDCKCACVEVKLPDIQPCISIAWGDSTCDCLETDDLEILSINVSNCYSNVTFNDFNIGHILITDMAGKPVPNLPDGTPSVQLIPSGPICFGNIDPCQNQNDPTTVSRELVLRTRGAIGKDYLLSFEGVCFTVSHHFQSKQCFVVKLCQD
jgi:hypothetical protein